MACCDWRVGAWPVGTEGVQGAWLDVEMKARGVVNDMWGRGCGRGLRRGAPGRRKRLPGPECRDRGSGGAMAGPGWAPPRLDEFILTEPLGSGTYATVYKAYRKVGPSPPRGSPFCSGICPPTHVGSPFSSPPHVVPPP